MNHRVVLSLATLYAMRMLGLFIVMPVFTLYGAQLEYATPTLMGMAIGAYGLTQALFQIPLGFVSDRLGRKPVILLGLVVFAIGSLVAACSSSIYGVILGRSLQGAGAISATVMALMADLTPEQRRTSAMAVIGMTIGLSFALAMILGPALAKWVGLSGVFVFTAALAFLGMWVTYYWIPTPTRLTHHVDVEASSHQVLAVLSNVQLLKLNLGIFVTHLTLTANFVVLPGILSQWVDKDHHSWIYLPVLVSSFLIMVPLIVLAEKRNQMKRIFTAAIFCFGCAEILLGWYDASLKQYILILLLFFVSFNLLEANLPSLVSRLAPAGFRGTAMGVYSVSQFIGISFGGLVGGVLLQYQGATAVFEMCSALILIWFITNLVLSPSKNVS